MTADHDDALHDAIALVECAGSGDELAARAVLANCDPVAVAVRLARLVAELPAENERGNTVCCPECFRSWALDSARPR